MRSGRDEVASNKDDKEHGEVKYQDEEGKR